MRIVALAGITAGLASCQSPEYVGSIGEPHSGEQAGLHLVATAMPTYQQVAPPFGYVGFCVRNPEDCAGGTDKPVLAEMTDDKWTELNRINDQVNRAVPQVTDMELYERAEWWAYPDARGGDCEDFALEKQKLLIQHGWAPENLLVSVIREWNGDGHAVLLVKTDRGEFVLDNKIEAIVAWSDAPYQWIKRQSEERPYVWVNLDPNAARMAGKAKALPPLGEAAPFLASVEKKAKPAPNLRPAIEDERIANRRPYAEERTAALH